MKQKYKVFINDKVVLFINESDAVPDDGYEVNQNLTSAEIVDYISSFQPASARIFYLISDNPVHCFENFINYFPQINAAGGVVRLHNLSGPILMIHRLGKWDLPKGKIDPGESPEVAAIREVQEECGISRLHIDKPLTNTYHLYEYKGVTVLKSTIWYLMWSDDTGALQPQSEEGITEARWVAEKDVNLLLPGAYASISNLLSETVLNC